MERSEVLVIEDSLITQEALSGVLETQEIKTVAVFSGEEAFWRLQEGLKPLFIILDINLPGMKGDEVFEKLRLNDEWKKIPVITFSSAWDESLGQPFERDFEVVKKYLKASELNREVDGGFVTTIIPKYQGQESTEVVHPRVIISIARILIREKIDLSPSFRHLVRISQRQIEGQVS